jgi:AraC-like DNA-binding protein
MDQSRDHPWVRPQLPAPDLAAEVVCSWRATVAGTHRLVPDGCVDLLWHDRGTMWVCGPETRAWELTLPAGVEAAGLRFRPGVARQVLGIDLHHLADRHVRLEDVLGQQVERELSERIASAAGAGRLATLEGAARRWLQGAGSPDRADVAIARAATAERRCSVDQLARDVGLSCRQVHRRSVRLFGYGPTMLMRLVRFQRFIVRAQRGENRSLGVLAAASGYSDQAHLVRECREIVGVPPSLFLPSHDKTFPPTSDPYKTPG